MPLSHSCPIAIWDARSVPVTPPPEVHQHVYIGIERQITRIGVQHRRHTLDVQTGKLRYHLLCMCAEIVCTQRGTDLFRLKTPCRGVHLAVNRTGNDPVLRMLYTDMQKIPLDLIAGHALVASVLDKVIQVLPRKRRRNGKVHTRREQQAFVGGGGSQVLPP